VLDILKELFPEVLDGPALRNEQLDLKKKRMSTTAFSKYSTFRAPATGVEHRRIRDFLREAAADSQPSAFMRKVLAEFREKQKLADFLHELVLFRAEIEESGLSAAIIRVIYENVGTWSAGNRGFRGLFRSEYDKAVKLFIELLNGMAPQERAESLTGMITQTSNWYFGIDVIKRCRKNALADPRELDDLEITLADRLTMRFINEGNNLLDEVRDPQDAFSVLFAWGTWNSHRCAERVGNYIRDKLLDAKVLVAFGRDLGVRKEEEQYSLDVLKQNLAAWAHLISIPELDQIAVTHLRRADLDSDNRAFIERLRILISAVSPGEEAN
jgi:hypothetical protein